MIRRMAIAYLAVGRSFGAWVLPLLTVPLFVALRTIVGLGMLADRLFFPRLWRTRVQRPT